MGGAAASEEIVNGIKVYVMGEVSDHLEMDMVVDPFLGQMHVHSLIEFPFPLLDGAVAILGNEHSLLSFPRKLGSCDHISDQPIVFEDSHTRI